MSIEDKFGPFARVFEKGELEVPGHLELLGLNSSGAQIVIDRIVVAMKIGDTQRWLTALLHDVNWRPHLVGAIALLLDPTLDSSPRLGRHRPRRLGDPTACGYRGARRSAVTRPCPRTSRRTVLGCRPSGTPPRRGAQG